MDDEHGDCAKSTICPVPSRLVMDDFAQFLPTCLFFVGHRHVVCKDQEERVGLKGLSVSCLDTRAVPQPLNC